MIIIPFGKPIGIDKNYVVAFSSDENTNPNTDNYSFLHIESHDNTLKVFCGIKYQCVEYVRRWLIINHKITFEQIDMAYQLFTHDRIKFHNIFTKNIIPYIKCQNGSDIYPKIGSVLLWDKTDDYLTGHVAVVLNIDNDYVYIGEQNWKDTKWSHYYSRKIPIKKILNQIWLNDTNTNQFNLKILGWLNLDI
jgi:glutathionylspermidine amidase/synthetase